LNNFRETVDVESNRAEGEVINTSASRVKGLGDVSIRVKGIVMSSTGFNS
jgi:hypothetical protein